MALVFGLDQRPEGKETVRVWSGLGHGSFMPFVRFRSCLSTISLWFHSLRYLHNPPSILYSSQPFHTKKSPAFYPILRLFRSTHRVSNRKLSPESKPPCGNPRGCAFASRLHHLSRSFARWFLNSIRLACPSTEVGCSALIAFSFSSSTTSTSTSTRFPENEKPCPSPSLLGARCAFTVSCHTSWGGWGSHI